MPALSLQIPDGLERRAPAEVEYDAVNKARFRPATASHFSRHGSDYIVCRQGPPDPLQLELAHGFDLHGVLDFHQHSRADEDLTWLGFVAEPGGYIGHRPDSGVVEPALEANGAERGKAVCNAEANLVPEPTPPIGKFKFREAEAGDDLSARSRQLQLTFGTKYVAM